MSFYPDIYRLNKAYIELLQIDDNILRLRLQPTYCFIRDALAEKLNKSPQTIQEECEAEAVHIKYNS